MRWLAMALLTGGVLAWAAPAVEQAVVQHDSAAARADDQPASSTRPADRARPMVGPRGRPLPEGRPRREAGPMGRRGQSEGRRTIEPDDPLTPEQVEQILRFARENLPQVHARLERLQRVDPAAYRQILRRMRTRLQPILETRKRNPELAAKLIEDHRLQLSIMDLAQKYRRASSDSERDRIRNELTARLRERFELNQDRARREIENLRRRLDEQAGRLAERERRKEQILAKELERAISATRPGRDANSDQ